MIKHRDFLGIYPAVKQTINCPECRKYFTLKGRVSDLPKDSTLEKLKKLVDTFSIQDGENDVTCDICKVTNWSIGHPHILLQQDEDREDLAGFVCADCNKSYCNTHKVGLELFECGVRGGGGGGGVVCGDSVCCACHILPLTCRKPTTESRSSRSTPSLPWCSRRSSSRAKATRSVLSGVFLMWLVAGRAAESVLQTLLWGSLHVVRAAFAPPESRDPDARAGDGDLPEGPGGDGSGTAQAQGNPFRPGGFSRRFSRSAWRCVALRLMRSASNCAKLTKGARVKCNAQAQRPSLVLTNTPYGLLAFCHNIAFLIWF